MAIRRRYSIDPSGNITVKDWPGDPRERDISDQYDGVSPAGRRAIFHRVEASLTLDEGPPANYTAYDDGTAAGKRSRKELMDQAMADLELEQPHARAF